MNERPTVVFAALDDVDFVAASGSIEPAWSMFGLKHQIAAGLPVHALRVAMTIRPDLGTRVLLPDKRIVRRHAAVVVEAQRFSAE